jgi:hypothetical protein
MMTLIIPVVAKDMTTSPVTSMKPAGEETGAYAFEALPIKCIVVGAQALGEVADGISAHAIVVSSSLADKAFTANKEEAAVTGGPIVLTKYLCAAAAGSIVGTAPVMAGPLPDIVVTFSEVAFA